jgi:hypothetical protein
MIKITVMSKYVENDFKVVNCRNGSNRIEVIMGVYATEAFRYFSALSSIIKRKAIILVLWTEAYI